MDLGKWRLIVPDDVLVREVRGEAVLLNLVDEQYYGMDPDSRTVWRALLDAPRLSDAVPRLIETYDVTEAVLEADIRTLVDELVRKGLGRLEPAAPPGMDARAG